MTKRTWEKHDNPNLAGLWQPSKKESLEYLEELNKEENICSVQEKVDDSHCIVKPLTLDKELKTAKFSEQEVVVLAGAPQKNESVSEKRPEPALNDKPNESPSKTFSNGAKFKACKKAFIPFLVLAILGCIAAAFPEVVLNGLVKTADLDKLREQSEEVVDALPIIIKVLLYGISLGFIYLGFNQINQGTIHIFDSYILHKKGLMNKTKILYQELPSIEIHKAPLSVFFDLGHLEISTKGKDFQINNLEKPFEIRRLIVEKIKSKNNS